MMESRASTVILSDKCSMLQPVWAGVRAAHVRLD